jgi:DNA-binding HxlR family transcriptional regulator
MIERLQLGDASNRSASSQTVQSDRDGESVASVIEDVVGCKWTLHILGQIRQGVVRPGALQRSVAGLTTKVLNQRLSKLLRYGLLEKQTYPERPLHVEYHLTPFGQRLNRILDQIDELQRERDRRFSESSHAGRRQNRVQRLRNGPTSGTALHKGSSGRRHQHPSSGDLQARNPDHDESDAGQSKGRGWFATQGNAHGGGSDRANGRLDGVRGVKRK